MPRAVLSLLPVLAVIVAVADITLAASHPDLEPACAPDDNTYVWSLRLPEAGGYVVELSWDADFDPRQTMPFPGSGVHSLQTIRGGSTLYVRFADDHGASDSAAANGDLCNGPRDA